MDTWEPTMRHEGHASRSQKMLSFDEEEDRWEQLKNEMELEDDELEGEEENHYPDQVPLENMTKKRVQRKQPRNPQASKNQLQPLRQQTLSQAMSETDMEKLLNRYRIKEDEEEINVDVAQYLKDENEEEENDAIDFDANQFMATLTKNTIEKKKEKTPEPDPFPAQQEDLVPLITLEDQKFSYPSKNPTPHKEKKTLREKNVDTYLQPDAPTKSLELAFTVNASSSVSGTKSTNASNLSEILFYWFDAKEPSKNYSFEPGSIFLFGKACLEENGKETFQSCCIHVKNIERTIFLLPNPGSSESEVFQEINNICCSLDIRERKVKFVERYYCFEEGGIPHQKTKWARLKYPAKYPPIPQTTKFRHITSMIGASRSLLELFILKRRMKGPCFLKASDLKPSTGNASYCKLEFVSSSPKNISVAPESREPPLFTLASIQILSQEGKKGSSNEVFIVSLAIYRNIKLDDSINTDPSSYFIGLRPFPDSPSLPIDLESYCSSNKLNGVERFGTEYDLLSWLTSLLSNEDPDILSGHNILAFTIETLLRRYHALNVLNWSSIGRLKLKGFPKFQSNGNLVIEKEVCIGRLVADSYLLSREYFKSSNYKLSSLAAQMGLKSLVRDPSVQGQTQVPRNQSPLSTKEIFETLIGVLDSATLSVSVLGHLDAIPLTKRLTTVAGNLWSRTLFGARSERIEYLLLHEFHSLKFIIPERSLMYAKRAREEEDGDGKRKAKYQGGMVLEPQCGLYSDYILLLDFNSLYPSIIQEFKICFTTLDCRIAEDAMVPPPESLLCEACAALGSAPPCAHKCVLPKVISSLVKSRQQVKSMMRTESNPNELRKLEIRQKAFKLTANSMYGCLGFEFSRFYAPRLAELVTRQGRHALQSTVELIPRISPVLRVIYGDTDSVMIQTGIKDNIKDVRELGFQIKSQVNKGYQSLEIDIDGVFRAILLLKKKKYAALSVVDWQAEGKKYKKEVKGLDMVRRDWCPLSQKVSEEVLNKVLYTKDGEDILDYIMRYMRQVAESVRRGDSYSLDEFVISKSLTKEPEAYSSSGFPHAVVALRMKARREPVRAGDLIPYVICEGEKLCDKAFHVDEVRKDKSLRLDCEWYLESQIYPPIMRLCEHIQGFSAAQLSENMGLTYNGSTVVYGGETQTTDDFSHCTMFKRLSLSDSFPTAIPFQVSCPHCMIVTPIDPHERVTNLLAECGGSCTTCFDLYICTSCKRSLSLPYLANCFTQVCHTIISQFYAAGGDTNAVRIVRSQFTYFRALFDIPHSPGCPTPMRDAHFYFAYRCIGLDKKLYTLSEAKAGSPAIREVEPVDPLLASAQTFYNRIDHHFIDLEKLFN